MSRQISVLVVAALFFTFPVKGKEAASKYKIIEVKHFSRAEGVELPPSIPELLYAELAGHLKNTGVAEQIIGEGEVVDASDVGQAVTLEGEFLEHKKGSALKRRFIGWAGWKGLRVRFVVRRYNTTEVVLEREVTQKLPPEAGDETVARLVATKVAGEVKKHLKR